MLATPSTSRMTASAAMMEPFKSLTGACPAGSCRMLIEGGLILLERPEFFSLEEHLFGCGLPVPWQGLEHRQPAFSPVEDEQHDGGQHPQRADDARVVVGQQHHHEEEKDSQEPEYPEDGKPDLVAAIGHPDVERHLVRPRRERILEAQDEERNEHQ